MSRRDDHSGYDGDLYEVGDPLGHDTVDAQITARLLPGAAQDADTALVRALATVYALPREAEAALDRVRATLPARLAAEQLERPGTRAPRGWPARLASQSGARAPERPASPLTMFLRAAAAVALLAVLGGGFYAVFSLRGGGRPTGLTPTPTPTLCPTAPGRVGLWRDASISADKTRGVPLNFDPSKGVTYAVSDASGMIFAAGGGHLWYSMDGASYCRFSPDLPPIAAGQAWAIATVPGGPGVFASPMAAGTNITAAGAQLGRILYAAFGDSGWRQLQGPVINSQSEFPSPSASGTDPVGVWQAIFLHDVMSEYPPVLMAQGRLFVVGSTGLISTPDMSGKAWKRVDNQGTVCSRFAVNPYNAQQVFCQGSSGGAISETSDGGQNWQALPTGQGPAGTTLVGASASAVYAYVEDAVESTGVSRYALAGGGWQQAVHLPGGSVIDVSPSDTVYAKESVNDTNDVQVQFFSLAPGARAFESAAAEASLPISGENVAYGMGGIWPGQEPAAYAWEFSYRAGGTTQPLYRLALPQQAPPTATAVPSATVSATAAPTASVAPAPAPAPFTPTGVTPPINGVLYVTTNNGYVFALDAATGHVVWRFQADAVAGYPNVANGVVYVGAQDPPSGGPNPSPGYLFALNASTGALIWKVPTPKPTGPEVILNGVLYGGTYENDVYAFRASDGHLLWTYGTGGCYTAPMATDGTNIYVNTVDCAGIIALHTNGTLAWRGNFFGGGTPVVVNGVLYNGPCAFRTASGSQLWCFQTDQGNTNFTDAVSGGVDYVPTSTSLYAVNATSGAVMWHIATQHMQALQGVVGTTIYTSGSDGYDPNLHALQTSDGSPRWTAPVRPAEGTLQPGSGVIYVGSAVGTMYALNPADGSVVWKTVLQ